MDDADFTPEELALFEADAAEAERGYSTEFLDSCRKLGRAPTIGRETAVVIPFRLDPERALRLADAAARTGKTRSQLIRDALDRQIRDIEATYAA